MERDTAVAVDPNDFAVHDRLWYAFEGQHILNRDRREEPPGKKPKVAKDSTPGRQPNDASATDLSDRFGDPEYSPGAEFELMFNDPAGNPAFDIARYKAAYPHVPKPLGEAAMAGHKARMEATPFPDGYETRRGGIMPKITNRTEWGNAAKAVKDDLKAMFEHCIGTGPHRLPLAMTCQGYMWGKNAEGDVHTYSLGTVKEVVRFYIEHGIIPEPWEVFPEGSLYVNTTLGCPSPGIAVENMRVGDWIKFLEAWKVYIKTASEQTAAMSGLGKVAPTRPPEIDLLRARAKEIDRSV